ncbi:MAG: cell division protein FtsZ [Candidatus Pacebacteria bacterium]|nr:cell division protein FtsZ [Candidatus Paceibacterota bacterium]
MKPKTKTKTKIKVIGIGGAGNNAISRMFSCDVKGIDLIAINTDVQDLKKVQAHQKLRIGGQTAKGLGSGMNPLIGRESAEESRAELTEFLGETDMVFITAGLGGGTGTGASPILAEMAKKRGILVVAVVTKPFSFEGRERIKIAEQGLEELRKQVDTLLIIPNDRILKLVDEKTSLIDAFWLCDDVLRQAVQGISDLIVLPGMINVDFADVKMIMKNSGPALLGMGKAKGEDRAKKAALQAINSPLIDFSIKGGRAVLFNISTKDEVALTEIDEVAQVITEKLHPQVKVIFGAVQDRRLERGEIKITVIATGFKH